MEIGKSFEETWKCILDMMDMMDIILQTYTYFFIQVS
jgi:hypothetical protein